MNSFITLILNKITGFHRFLIFFFCLILVFVLGFIDYKTSNEFSFDVFYLIPIVISSLLLENFYSFFIVFFSVICWYFGEIFLGRVFSNYFFPIWNTFVRLMTFFIISFIIIKLKNLFLLEMELSETDSLTGSHNRKYIYKTLNLEIERAKRNKLPLSIAYIDVDNFKNVNDTKGHKAGDMVLKTLVSIIKKNLRIIDSVSRIGGDEFIILFINASYEDNRNILQRILANLKTEIKVNSWDISFSIGVVTCRKKYLSTEKLIEKADKLMYEVKKSGKNNIKSIEV